MENSFLYNSGVKQKRHPTCLYLWFVDSWSMKYDTLNIASFMRSSETKLENQTRSFTNSNSYYGDTIYNFTTYLHANKLMLF